MPQKFLQSVKTRIFYVFLKIVKGLYCSGVSQLPNRLSSMVSEMVQYSQSLYSFSFNAVIDIHEYIYSHSTTKFTFKKYIYSHLPPFSLIRDFGKQNTRGNVSKISVSLRLFRKRGVRSLQKKIKKI